MDAARLPRSRTDDVEVTPKPEFQASPQLLAVMRCQRGIFTADQAYAGGYAPSEIQRLRAVGVLHSVRRGIYASAATYGALDPIQRHQVDTQAALLCLREPAILSHESAAAWTGMPLLRPELGLVHVTRPELRSSRREADIHHHPGALPSGHATTCAGTAVTTPARTAVDIARNTNFARALAAVDSCLRGGVRRDELIATMEFCASWPGARSASRAVSAGDGRAANPGESWSRAVLIEAGLEPTALQLEVRDAAGLVGFADFGWEDRMTLGEFDGRLKYAVPLGADAGEAARVVWAEKRREDRLRARGFEVVRWTWEDLFRPAQLVGRVLAAFARADGRRRTAN